MTTAIPRPDDYRRRLGFLTVQEVLRVAGTGVCVLDSASTLLSHTAVIAPGAVLYPGIVVNCDESSLIVIGTGTLLYPGTFLLATGGGEIVVGDQCELGPGGAQVKANTPGTTIRIGNGARLLNGSEVVGNSQIGDGCQIIGPIAAQSVQLEGGRGGYMWPEPSERGAVLKGCGLARGIRLSMGQVKSMQPSFADGPIESQSSYHPQSSPVKGVPE